MSSDFLWSEASADVHAERAALERSKALVALSEVRGFLIKASSAEEYDDRLSLMREDVNRVLAATDLSVHEEVLASLRADFEAVLAASRKTSASGDIGVGSDVIWTEFGVPDFKGKEFMTSRGKNGQPWTVTKVESLWDYGESLSAPDYGYLPDGNTHIYDLVEEWSDKHHQGAPASAEPRDVEVAHITRGGDSRVVPLESLINSSVEVGAGQGQFSFASQKTAAAPQFDGHVTSENATVGQKVVLMGSSGNDATVIEVLPGHVKVRRAGGQIGDVLDYGWEDGQSYLMTPESVHEASVRTASGEWGESEWSDEGASRVGTVPGREGYLVADVYPSEFETGVWVWSIKPAYPLSEYPEVYDLGHAANMDEAKAAADTAMGRAIQSYSREASVRTASASRRTAVYKDPYGVGKEDNPMAIYMGLLNEGGFGADNLFDKIMAANGPNCLHESGASDMATYGSWSEPRAQTAAQAMLGLLGKVDDPRADTAIVLINKGLRGQLS